MLYSPEVKASIIRVAGDITVEYLRQYPNINPEDTLPWQLDSVIKCFQKAYTELENFIPKDQEDAY